MCVVVLAAHLSNPHITGLYHDDGIYIATAKSLAETGSYRLIDLPGSPLQTKYPPLYPMLLAAVWTIAPGFPVNLWLLKLVNALLLGAIVILVHDWLCRVPDTSAPLRVVTVLAVATAPGLFSYADLVLSEPLFLALMLAVIVLDPTSGERASRGRTLGAALFAGLSALARSVGLAVCLALVWQLWGRLGWRRALLAGGVALVVVTPWLVMATLGTPGNGLLSYYQAYEAPAWRHLLGNPGLTWRMIFTNAALLCSAVPAVFGFVVSGAAVLAAALMGLGAAGRPARHALALAGRIALLYAGVVLMHPYPMERYLIPLVPLGYVLLALGARRLATRLSVPRLSALPVLILLCGNMVWLAHFRTVVSTEVHGELGRALPFEWSGFEETIAWVNSHAPARARLASSYDSLYFMFTGRQAVRPVVHRPEQYVPGYGLPVPVPDGSLLAGELRGLGVNYLVVDPLLSGRESDYGRASVRAVLDREPEAWHLVFASGDGRHEIYERAGSH